MHRGRAGPLMEVSQAQKCPEVPQSASKSLEVPGKPTVYFMSKRLQKVDLVVLGGPRPQLVPGLGPARPSPPAAGHRRNPDSASCPEFADYLRHIHHKVFPTADVQVLFWANSTRAKEWKRAFLAAWISSRPGLAAACSAKWDRQTSQARHATRRRAGPHHLQLVWRATATTSGQ